MIERKLLSLDLEDEEMRKRINERLVFIRKNVLNISQNQLGVILGISTDRVIDFENGKRVTDQLIIYKYILYLMTNEIDIRLLFLDEIPIEEIADKIGTINYEVACVIGKRIPRFYVSDNKIYSVLNYLIET